MVVDQRLTVFALMNSLRCWLLSVLALACVPAFGQETQAQLSLTVDELTCRGNATTSCDFILGHVYLVSGDNVDEEELDNARLRLMSLPSFQSVDIYLEKGAVRGRVRVVIEVVEADPYAREWLAGTSARFDSLSQLLTGRITHQNLFGSGRLLDMSLVAFVPIDGQIRSEYGARLQYVDPHWLDSKRSFFIAGIGAGHSEFEDLSDERLRIDNVGLDVTFGRRIFDFSYLSLRYRYNPLIDVEHTLTHLDGTTEHRADSFDNHILIANYGWNSEDDPYFPTRGSRANVAMIWASTATGFGIDGGLRKTWTTDGGTSWLLQIADTPGTEYRYAVDETFEWMAGFARPIAGSANGELRRGRWYVEAGYTPQGQNASGQQRKEYGLKLGVRLDTRSFGIVELYVIGSGLRTSRSEP
jgi:outer membrane protein assembly factor BamA